VTEELVTILFTDVEGSTALHVSKGDAEARSILARCEEVVRLQVQVAGGREIKALGDGLMVVFRSPLAAISCALEIQDALKDHRRRHPGQEARVGVGIHTGLATEEGGDLFGSAVNAAARIAAKAQGDEVLVSDVVRQLCSSASDVSFEPRGHMRLKGFPERWRVYRVLPRVQGIPAGESTPFVGREYERSALRELMKRAARGQGGLVLLGGEPGIGKTRLAHEAAAEARRPFRVFIGHCYEGQGELPYMPWVEILEQCAREVTPESLRQSLGDDAPELARLFPKLRHMFPDIPPPLELPLDQQRRYTFNSVREYITRTSRVRPQLFVLEDLHWADESTLHLLEHLAERLPQIPCLVVGTYRDAPIDVSPQLGEALSTLVRHRQAQLLTLTRHSAAETAAMLRSLSGHPPPPALTAAVYAETEGNAFFVEEVFRHLAESGKVFDSRGRFRSDLRIEELDVPANVRLVTGRRLDRLSEPTHGVLSVAAVIGRHFSFEVLENVVQLGAEALLDALDEAEEAQLIASESSDAQERYWFTHELIRHTLLTRLSAPRRRRHHLRIADALEQLHAGDLEFHAADIAHHLAEAGKAADHLRTAAIFTLAGDRALEAAAFDEALRFYQQALALLPPQEARRRTDVLFRLGKAQRSLCRWEDAMAAFEQALTALEALGDTDPVADVCWDFGSQLVWAYRPAEVVRVTERGLRVLGNAPSRDRARMLALSAVGLSAAGRFQDASARLDEAQRLARTFGDAELLGEIGGCEMLHHYFAMELEKSLERGRRSAEQLRRAGAAWYLADALSIVDTALTFSGRFDDSDDVEGELEPLAERLGHTAAGATLRRSRFAKFAAQAPDLGAFEKLSVAQLNAAQDMGNPGWLAYAHTSLGVVRFWTGDWDGARLSMEEARRLAIPGTLWFGIHHGFLIMVLAFLGRREEAWEILDEVRHALPQPHRTGMLGQWTLALLAAEAAGVLHDAELARRLYPLVVEALQTGTLLRQYDGRLIQTTAAITAAAAGQPDLAEEHFETALRQAEDLPHLMERPHVRHFYGRFLIDRDGRGDLARAGTFLQEAVAGYRAIGMPGHEAMARKLLARLG
jgi:class 3 adenylate cyclase/tetratricopeptide (TPR) repeat protein